MSKLRSVNSHALVLEISGYKKPKIYADSDGTLGDDWTKILILAGSTAGNINAKIDKLRYYSSQEAREMQITDPNSEWYTNLSYNDFKDFDPWISKYKLLQHSKIQVVLDLVGITEDQFNTYYNALSTHDEATTFLHHMWNLLYMDATGKTPEEISDSLTYSRLNDLLNSLEQTK